MKPFTDILNETFTSDNRSKLWEFVDYVFDVAAKDTTAIYLDLDYVFESVEDFCKAKCMTDIPPLYEYIFSMRDGNQCKLPIRHRKEWNARFPDPLPRPLLCDELNEYINSLEHEHTQTVVKSFLIYEFES
jgi:hypothetical protein